MGPAHAAKLVAWLASTALFALVAGTACTLVSFLFGAGQSRDLAFGISVGVLEVASLALAIREWRRTDGAIPSYLWWLVLGFGPGATVVIWAFATFGGS